MKTEQIILLMVARGAGARLIAMAAMWNSDSRAARRRLSPIVVSLARERNRFFGTMDRGVDTS
jgi:hypothetical protein